MPLIGMHAPFYFGGPTTVGMLVPGLIGSQTLHCVVVATSLAQLVMGAWASAACWWVGPDPGTAGPGDWGILGLVLACSCVDKPVVLIG